MKPSRCILIPLLDLRFWGASANAPKLTENLEAWFINRDAARIGNSLWNVFANTTAPGQYLGWIAVDPVAAGTNMDIANAIVQNQAWVAVVGEFASEKCQISVVLSRRRRCTFNRPSRSRNERNHQPQPRTAERRRDL